MVQLIERWKADRRAADRRAGEVAAMIYNAHRDAKKDPKGGTWFDIFPEWKEKSPPQSDEQMLTAMELWAAAHPGKFRRVR